jgi:hypothetical protein
LYPFLEPPDIHGAPNTLKLQKLRQRFWQSA